MRSMSTCGCSVPWASCPYSGLSPVSGSTVPSRMESQYFWNFTLISASYWESETPMRYFCGLVENSRPMVASVIVRM